MLGRAVQRPVEVAGTTLRLTSELLRIATGSTPRQPEKGDRRFADEAWRSNPLFTRVLQSYLAMESALSEYADHSGGQGRESERSKFLLSQVSSALAPTNFLATNPTALRTAAETGGQSLIKGARNMFNDVLSGRPIPSQVDESQFKVGKNLASTPGSVVARTEMFELIQYIPQTPKVREVPVLIVPSIVNKFYVLDLATQRSVIELMVRNRLTVYVWPGATPSSDTTAGACRTIRTPSTPPSTPHGRSARAKGEPVGRLRRRTGGGVAGRPPRRQG